MVPRPPLEESRPCRHLLPAVPTRRRSSRPPSPLTIHGQYIKDLSFENPRAPQSLIEQKQPQLTLNVNVATRQFDPKTFEVVADHRGERHDTGERAAVHARADLCRHGDHRGEVPQEAFGPLLLIETPRLLFPFARAIVANATREAGFPPLNISPVDFVALYRQQLERRAARSRASRRGKWGMPEVFLLPRQTGRIQQRESRIGSVAFPLPTSLV